MAVLNKRHFHPLIAMPCTKNQIGLYICLSRGQRFSQNESKLITIKICEVNIMETDKMKMFIDTLIFTVKDIVEIQAQPFEVEPKQGLILTRPMNSSQRIYLCGNKPTVVCKLYDATFVSDKEDVVRNLNIDSLHCTKTTLSNDKRFYMLEYNYVREKDKHFRTLNDYKAIMETLDKLHDNGYVHSDVRELNLLFPFHNTITAKLIDFDLMDLIGTRYPKGYNHLEERHAEAKAGNGRKTLHDRYSLVHILQKEDFYHELSSSQKKILEQCKINETPALTEVFSVAI